MHQKTVLINAICHQNWIGWDSFLKGYTTLYWKEAHLSFNLF